MSKLKIVVVSENAFIRSMAGCGRNNAQLCGLRYCGFTPGTSK